MVHTFLPFFLHSFFIFFYSVWHLQKFSEFSSSRHRPQTQNVLHAIRIYFAITFMPRFIVEGYLSLSAFYFHRLPLIPLVLAYCMEEKEEFWEKKCVYIKIDVIRIFCLLLYALQILKRERKDAC